jgi:hypothetical protein
VHFVESCVDSKYFYTKEDVKGYKLGVTTNESGKQYDDFGDYHDFIGIATLPYALFDMPSKRYGTIKPDKLEGKLKEYGWASVERNDIKYQAMIKSANPTGDYYSLAGDPSELNHKYFTVYYEHI